MSLGGSPKSRVFETPIRILRLVQQLVTGRGVDLGWSRLSHFQRGVVFRNPVFDFKGKAALLGRGSLLLLCRSQHWRKYSR